MLDKYVTCDILQLYGTAVVGINKDAKQVILINGDVIQYDSLISTLPLDVTLNWLDKPDWAQGLYYSSTHVVGVGIRGSW